MGSRAAGGGSSEGEGERDAEGGRMVAKKKKKGSLCGPGAQSCTSTGELASVYIQHKTIRAAQWEGQTVRKEC